MNFLEAMNFRHACKAFDPTQKISLENQKLILEFGRISPSSFGIDSCPIEGFESEHVKAALKEVVDWHQLDVSALCAFGYRAAEQTPRIREPLASVMMRED